MTLTIILCIALYLLATALQVRGLMGYFPQIRLLLLTVGLSAVLLHGFLLYHWIDQSAVQNLSLVNMLSFVIWLICLGTMLVIWRYPLQNLGLVMFPLAAITIGLIYIFPEPYLVQTSAHPQQLIHILTAASAFSILSLACIQALLLRVQDGLLRNNYAGYLIHRLPPLETMEKLLFQMVGLGFVLLSFVMVSSFVLFDNFFDQPLLEKTILVFITWLLFAILLAGRYFFGWRGRKITYQTFCGFILLIIIYFGSSFFMESFLG